MDDAVGMAPIARIRNAFAYPVITDASIANAVRVKYVEQVQPTNHIPLAIEFDNNIADHIGCFNWGVEIVFAGRIIFQFANFHAKNEKITVLHLEYFVMKSLRINGNCVGLSAVRIRPSSRRIPLIDDIPEHVQFNRSVIKRQVNEVAVFEPFYVTHGVTGFSMPNDLAFRIHRDEVAVISRSHEMGFANTEECISRLHSFLITDPDVYERKIVGQGFGFESNWKQVFNPFSIIAKHLYLNGMLPICFKSQNHVAMFIAIIIIGRN